MAKGDYVSPLHDEADDPQGRRFAYDLHFDDSDLRNPGALVNPGLVITRDAGCSFTTAVLNEPETGTAHGFALAGGDPGDTGRTVTLAELAAEGFVVYEDVGSHTVQ